ncbi:MAG: FAD binding domain-containing protein [Terriglobia bacterium]
MIPQAFEYHAPKSFAEAASLLSELGDECKILAGGHSLLPTLKLRLAQPRSLIDLTRLSELKYIRESDNKIEIGALTTHFQIESSDLLKTKCPLLPETAREIGDVQVRNRGTLGGSLAHSDPAADWPAAILALDAEIEARSASGSRSIAATDFFVDLLTTALRSDDILAAVRIPVPEPQTGWAYVKLHHPASGYATVGAAAVIRLGESGAVEHVRVGITGVGPKAYRAMKVEEAVKGKSAKALEAAAAYAVDGVDVNADLYASAEYRSHLAQVYTLRALEKALERARGK